jgi:autotransporter-associated beta strand protein
MAPTRRNPARAFARTAFAFRGGAIWDQALSVTKNGAGTITLTGNNSYSGGTTISAGTLQAGIEVDDSSLSASVSVRANTQAISSMIRSCGSIGYAPGVHHVGVKNDAGDERFTADAHDACGITQEPKSQAYVPVAVIDPDSGIFRGEYVKQATLNGHVDLTGRAAGREAVNIFVMVDIDVGPLAIKAGLPFDIAVQDYAPDGMSFDEFLPSDDNLGRM